MESRLLRSAALLARAARLARAAATSTGRAVTAEHLAEVVASAAGDRGFPSGALRQAALALARSSAPEARPRATAEVVRAAAMVFRAAQEAGSPGVAEVAGDLAHAAHDCVRALVESGPAAERPRCLLRLWRRKNRHNKNAAGEADLEAPLLHPHERPSSSSSPIGASLSEIIELSESERDFINYGMFGALAIFPYLTRTGGLKSAYSPLSPSTFHIIFCTWWICVGLDVLCGNRGRAMMKNILAFILAFYARASARLAILGVSLLVILYSHLELAPNEIYTLYILLGAATCMHLLVWAMDYMSRAPGDAAD
ncbi:hypothetical protein [Oryza sativa Japonica Group]|uniref:Uncharacterized protein n=2 Tax=Oryza sativa subsp. japonica TaxID=39947 RepID=Q5N8L8_ORYSJ|nr:hypothetical protein [Oryza sativa Japonica Group]BAD82351.1 hypothetical protein [Oryza sativa Japonica Group]